MIQKVKENIKAECKARSITIENLCKSMHKDRKYIYRMTDKVQAMKIINIAQAIGCAPSDLFKSIQNLIHSTTPKKKNVQPNVRRLSHRKKDFCIGYSGKQYINKVQEKELFCFHIGNRTQNQPTERHRTEPTETSFKFRNRFR